MNCTFEKNKAYDNNESSSLSIWYSNIVTIDECIFDGNSGANKGGAIYVLENN